jgi:hypothetical protein
MMTGGQRVHRTFTSHLVNGLEQAPVPYLKVYISSEPSPENLLRKTGNALCVTAKLTRRYEISIELRALQGELQMSCI